MISSTETGSLGYLRSSCTSPMDKLGRPPSPSTELEASGEADTVTAQGKQNLDLTASLERLPLSPPSIGRSPTCCEQSVRSKKASRSAEIVTKEKALLFSSLSSLSGIYKGTSREDLKARKDSLVASISGLDILLEDEDHEEGKESFNTLVASVQSLADTVDKLPETHVDLRLNESFRTLESSGTEDSTIHGSVAEICEAVSALLLSRHVFTVEEESTLEKELRSLNEMRKDVNAPISSPSEQLPLIPECAEPRGSSSRAKQGQLDAFLRDKRSEDYLKQKNKLVSLVTTSRPATRKLPPKSKSCRQSYPEGISTSNSARYSRCRRTKSCGDEYLGLCKESSIQRKISHRIDRRSIPHRRRSNGDVDGQSKPIGLQYDKDETRSIVLDGMERALRSYRRGNSGDSNPSDGEPQILGSGNFEDSDQYQTRPSNRRRSMGDATPRVIHITRESGPQRRTNRRQSLGDSTPTTVDSSSTAEVLDDVHSKLVRLPVGDDASLEHHFRRTNNDTKHPDSAPKKPSRSRD